MHLLVALLGCAPSPEMAPPFELEFPEFTPPDEACNAPPGPDGPGCVIDEYRGWWGNHYCPNVFVADLSGPSPEALNLRFERRWRNLDSDVLYEGGTDSFRFEYPNFQGAMDDDVLARLTVWLDTGECVICEDWLSLLDSPDPTGSDEDGDGSPFEVDCGSCDPTQHPGADDALGDGVDQDCDGDDG